MTNPIMTLGRVLNHDPRSLRYPFKASSIVLASAEHTLHIPVLDQGKLGSCTGNATVAALSGDPFYSTLVGKTLDENLAIKLYSAATILDPFSGAYPPIDTGSDGTSVAKAAQKAGYISGYTHAFTLNDALTALMTSPIIIGTNWYANMMEPSASGQISPKGAVQGGHEYCLWKLDVQNERVWLRNSWTDQWGINGTAWLNFTDLQQLLNEDGDVTVFTPLSVPAPTPTPVPPSPVITHDPADVALWSPETAAWAAARHTGSNAKAAKAVKAWAAAKGL